MGIMGKLFGAKVDYPALDASAPAAKHLKTVNSPIKQLLDETSEPLEVVPAEDTTYIFIGKPPKKFGIAWIEGGDKIVNFKSLVAEKGFTNDRLENLSDKLKEAYIAHQDNPRYVTRISDRDVVVIPSESLLDKLKGVVQQTVG